MNSSLSKVPFSPSFQRLLVATTFIQDPRIIQCLEIVKPEHFSTPGLPLIWEQIHRIYQETKVLPNWLMTKDSVYKAVAQADRGYYYRVLRRMRMKVTENEIKYVLKNVEEFTSLQRLASAYRTALPLFERGDLRGVRETLGSALQAQLEAGTTGHHLIAEVRDRVRQRLKAPTKVIRTLITPLDLHLRNQGLRIGETGCFLASSGVGKTRALCHVTKAAALQKKKSVYYTLQLPESDIAEILDSSLSGVPQRDLVEHGKEVIAKIERFGRLYSDSIIIKYFPRRKATIQSLRAHLAQVKLEGFEPNFVVIDFLNYLTVPDNGQKMRTQESKYYELQDIAGDFIVLCQELDLVGWTAMQGNRVSTGVELMSLAEIAESYGAAMEMTLAVSINRTPKEKENEKARLFLAKYTYGADAKVVEIGTNFSRGAFYKLPHAI